MSMNSSSNNNNMELLELQIRQNSLWQMMKDHLHESDRGTMSFAVSFAKTNEEFEAVKTVFELIRKDR